MSSEHGFSLILPLYNKEKTIARAVDSILKQDEPFEIIAVDDQSADRSVDIVRTYGDRVQLIQQSNAGPAAARNNGVRAARYDWLMFLDADDELKPGALRAHREALQQWPQYRLSLSSFEEPPPINMLTVLADRYAGKADAGPQCLHEFRFDFVISNVATCAIHRELYDAIGGFDESLRCWELTDFYARAVQRARGACLPAGIHVIKHYDGANSQYVKTRHDAEQQIRAGQKLLDLLPALPEAQKPAVLNQVRNFAVEASWQHRYRDAASLLRRASRMSKSASALQFLAYKLQLIACGRKLLGRVAK